VLYARYRGRLAGLLLLALASSGLAGVSAGEDQLDRPLRMRRGAGVSAAPDGLPLRASGQPDRFAPRDFPRVLRDSRLPTGPDGVLWRRLRAADPTFDLAAHATPTLVQLQSRLAAARQQVEADTIHVCVLRVDFLQDSAGNESTTETGRFDLRNGDSLGIIVDPPPHNRSFFESHMEALHRYYWHQSGGTLVLDYDVFPAEEDSAYHLSDTADYGPWSIGNSEEIIALAESLVRDSFAAADTSEAPPDFRAYESFMLFHAGADYQGDINRNSDYDIPSFNLFLAEPVAVQDSSFFIDLIMVVPETVSQDGFTAALNGVMAHEYGHQLGFFDLYDVLTFFPQVGMFSLMDSGEQLYGTVVDSTTDEVIYVRGAIPASLDPWHKILFFPGGVQPRWLTQSGRATVPAVQTKNEITFVPIGGQWLEYLDQTPGWWAPWYASEYFILENRPYDLNGDGAVILESDPETGVFMGPGNVEDEGAFAADTLGAYEHDYLLPGSGILIWHVDNAAIQAALSYCGGCINISRERRGVDIEEADGIEDLGDLYSVQWTGGAYDYWFRGGYDTFGPDTDPDTRAGGGGITGIQMVVLDSAATVMRVSVRLGLERAGWPIYYGDPITDESISLFDLDGEGTPEIFAAMGRDVRDSYARELLAFWPDARPYPYADGTGRIAESDSAFLPGVALAAEFAGATRSERLVAAATSRSVRAWDPYGEVLLDYPGGDASWPDLRFTTAPMALDSVLVVGDGYGRLRGLLPGAATPLLWRTATPGGEVTVLAAGDLYGDGSTVLAWGDALGDVRVATGSQRNGFVAGADWPVRVGDGGDPLAALWILEAPVGEPGQLLAVTAGGHVALIGADGACAQGWPLELGSPVAGAPAIGDPDGDGALEIAITSRDGRIHLLRLQGTYETRWPHSVWHPDTAPFAALTSGPALVDLTGDGVPEIVQGSGDGAVHAFRPDASPLPGWPLASGYPIGAGPIVGPLDEGGDLGLATIDAMGFVHVLGLGLEGRPEAPGEMWRADGGPARRHCYPRHMLPAAPPLNATLLEPENLLFTPNPIRGASGQLRFRMGATGTLRMQLFDASGQRVWEGERQPDDVHEETVWSFDVSDLASGLYVARISARGGGDVVAVTRKLAIIR